MIWNLIYALWYLPTFVTYAKILADVLDHVQWFYGNSQTLLQQTFHLLECWCCTSRYQCLALLVQTSCHLQFHLGYQCLVHDLCFHQERPFWDIGISEIQVKKQLILFTAIRWHFWQYLMLCSSLSFFLKSAFYWDQPCGTL